jgi:para-nitrobenzyl esterase
MPSSPVSSPKPSLHRRHRVPALVAAGALVLTGLLGACTPEGEQPSGAGDGSGTPASSTPDPGAADPTAAPATTPGPKLDTPDGPVQGVDFGDADAQAFYGLPFAQPPIYDDMWTAPSDPDPWDETRDATRQGPACLQFDPTGVTNAQPTSLDCLYLDVYRPANAEPNDDLPVMVFYHGGGNTQGSGVLYGGQTMADRENVIVVSTNYRLGASGSFALDALDDEDPSTGGDFALLDQIQTLTWVKRSISSFGGNPENVTIFGQSAGGQAVCKLLASPKAEGLFDKAILESSPCSGYDWNSEKDEAEEDSEAYAEAAGCPAGDDQLECLRKAWPPDLVTAFQQNTHPAPFTGSDVLPTAPTSSIESGDWNKVPVMLGTTRWESRLLRESDYAITAKGYEKEVRDQYGDDADQVLAAYPVDSYESPFQALAALETDTGKACPAEDTAQLFDDQDTPVYKYEFDDPTSPTLFGFQPEDTDMSSGHSAELAYLFDFTLGDRQLDGEQTELAHAMQAYWAAFARSGNPAVEGAPEWPVYTTDSPFTLSLAPKIKPVKDFTAEHQCDLAAELDG